MKEKTWDYMGSLFLKQCIAITLNPAFQRILLLLCIHYEENAIRKLKLYLQIAL